MRRIRHHFASAGVLALAAALAACSAEPLHPEAIPVAPKTVQVAWQVEPHPVQFAIGSDRPAPGEIAGIDRFLAQFADETSVQVFVATDPATAGRALAERRFALLERHLAARGFAARPMTAEIGGGVPAVADPRIATVYVGHFVAAAPGCPDWRKPTAADFTNTHSSNFGCATAVNFSQMLANPGDLLRGQPLGPADAERAARSIRDYREGAPKDQQNGGAAGIGGMSTTTGSGGTP